MSDAFISGLVVGWVAGVILMFLVALAFPPTGDSRYICEKDFKGEYSKTYDSKTGDAIYHCKGAH